MAERGLPDLPGILGAMRQRLEDRGERLAVALPGLIERKRGALSRIAPRLPHPREGMAARRAALGLLDARRSAALHRAVARAEAAPALARFSATPVAALVREKRARLEGLVARLEGVSYQAVLARGFALVSDAEGAPLTTAASVPAGARLSLTFADGQVGATADGKAARRKRESGEQGALL
jgi:exodeoxyribonuclease VII large subunit